MVLMHASMYILRLFSPTKPSPHGRVKSVQRMPAGCSLLLTTRSALLFTLARNNFAKHYDPIPVHKGDPRQALAILEGVAHERLLRLEAALRHLVRLERVRVFHFFAACLLAHLPLQLADPARGTAAAHEADRRVADLDLVRDVEHLDLRVELPGLAQCRVLLVDHHITGSGHIIFVQTLDVQTYVVAWIRKVNTLVVHLHGEDLTRARVGCRVRGQEDHLLSRLDHALLHATCEHIADTLDLVDPRDRHAHGRTDRPLGHTAELVQHIVNGIYVDRLFAVLNVLTLPPPHVVRLLQQVVTHPTRDGQHWCVLLDEILLPTDFHKHALHLIGNLVITPLLVGRGVAIHLVHTDADLLDTQQVDESGVLAGLALDLTGLVVALRNGRGEIAISGDHDERNIRLRGPSDHVLDEITMAWGINDRIVPLLSVELLGGARDGHATLAFLLLSVHVECKSK
mmetsp:Transcript_107546/g.269790  ORF Transcript_107546/g.269790 Transcript_107546/m.269790 type:complete len:456 (-) Transcript_107546:255-1622(-)